MRYNSSHQKLQFSNMTNNMAIDIHNAVIWAATSDFPPSESDSSNGLVQENSWKSRHLQRNLSSTFFNLEAVYNHVEMRQIIQSMLKQPSTSLSSVTSTSPQSQSRDEAEYADRAYHTTEDTARSSTASSVRDSIEFPASPPTPLPKRALTGSPEPNTDNDS